MSYSFDPAARRELLEAADWYEQRQSGLGAELTFDVHQTIDEIVESPKSNAHYEERSNVRYRQTRRFPYLIMYRIGVEQIEIIAVAHTRQRPGYWKDRLDAD